MPELPEVQTTVDGINHFTKGLTIIDVWSDYDSAHYAGKDQIKNREYFTKFRKKIIGAEILRAHRRAKNVLIELSNGETILIHMKMTGHLLYGEYRKGRIKNRKGIMEECWYATDETSALADPFNSFIHLVFALGNHKHLAFSDMRKFAKVTLLNTESLAHSPELTHIGPEPLDDAFTVKILSEQLSKKPNGKIKSVLMDQTVLAGVGNIYSDEILFASNIHPLTLVKNLKPKNVQDVWKHMRNILRSGIDFGGDSMSDYRNLEGKPGKFQYHHKAYRQTRKQCSKKGCKGIIERMMIGGRSSHFCPVHQKIIR